MYSLLSSHFSAEAFTAAKCCFYAQSKRPTVTGPSPSASLDSDHRQHTLQCIDRYSLLRLETGNKDTEQASPRLLQYSTLQAGTERPTVLYVQSLGPMYRTQW